MTLESILPTTSWRKWRGICWNELISKKTSEFEFRTANNFCVSSFTNEHICYTVFDEIVLNRHLYLFKNSYLTTWPVQWITVLIIAWSVASNNINRRYRRQKKQIEYRENWFCIKEREIERKGSKVKMLCMPYLFIMSSGKKFQK